MAKYFGTNGVRGKFDELTPELTLKLAQAIGMYLSRTEEGMPSVAPLPRRETGDRKPVIVGQDCRLTGEVLRSAVVSGLASVGCPVMDIGVVSSPTAEFMVKKLEAAGCIIVTASHNPAEWNALKVVDGNGVAVSHERGSEIEALMERIKLADWNRVGLITHYGRATTDHIQAITNLIDRTKIDRKTIVLDCGNGTACLIAPALMTGLGAKIIILNGEPDGTFPGRPSEPTETNVRLLIETVKKNRADAGIAWDGDGDRVIFVDEKGNYVIGDKVFALSVIWKLGGEKKAKKGKTARNSNRAFSNGDVATTVATSKAVEDVARSLGARVHYTAIGAPYLSEEMSRGKDSKTAIGGEEVGGVIWPELSLAKDGFFVAAKLLEAINQKPLSQWLKSVPIYHTVKLKIEVKGPEAKKQIVERVMVYAKKKKLKMLTIDGIRVDFKSAWVIVRASGTENYVRVFAEAKTKEKAERLAKEFEKIAKG